MRILLLTSGLTYNSPIVTPPLGLYRIKNYLSGFAIPCDIYDSSLDDIDTFLCRAAAGEYDIIGFGTAHISFEQDINVLKRFRDCCGKDVLFVAGGQEATHNHAQVLAAGFDVVALGLGEYVMLEIARALDGYRREGFKAFAGIAGIAYAGAAGIQLQKARRVEHQDIQDLFYDQVLKSDIPYTRYWSDNSTRAKALSFNNSFIPEMVRLYTATRCPSHCGYCSSHRFLRTAQGEQHNGMYLSGRQVAELVVWHHQKYGAKIFLFSDDEFLAWRKRSREFCEEILAAKARGDLHPDVAFHCQARVIDFLSGGGVVDIDLIARLRQAGFTGLSLGVESFSERLLRTPIMNKPGYDKHKALKVINALLTGGLRPHVFIILCVPDATPEDILDNVRTILTVVELGCSISISPLVYVLPGSPAHDLSGYPVKTTPFVSPVTHQTIPLVQYFIPRDSAVAALAENFQDITERVSRRVLREIGWKQQSVNYLMETQLRCIGIAEFFGDTALAEAFLERLRTGVAEASLQ